MENETITAPAHQGRILAENPQSWIPTADQLHLGMHIALSDKIPDGCDAIFVHGAPACNEDVNTELFMAAKNLMVTKKIGYIVLNGLSHERCKARNLAYQGFEGPLGLLKSQGVDEEKIILLEPSVHTELEARNLLKLAKERGWKRLVISSFPHHQIRCFLTIIGVMESEGYLPEVYNAPGPAIACDKQLFKPVLDNRTVGGGVDIHGTYLTHIAGEMERIEEYAQPPTFDAKGKQSHTRHATIPEMVRYLEYRSQLASSQS